MCVNENTLCVCLWILVSKCVRGALVYLWKGAGRCKGRLLQVSLVVTRREGLWGQPGPASAHLVWFGLGQSVIVMLETTKSRLWPEPHPCTGVRD